MTNKRVEKEQSDKSDNENNKRVLLIVFISFVILTLIILVLTGVIPIGKEKTSAFNQYNELYNSSNLIEHQLNIDSNIIEGAAMASQTMEKPLIVVNPYGTSPLTAVVAFNTAKETSITANLLSKNGSVLATFNSINKKDHYIAILGLHMGEDNKVELKDSEGKTSIITIPIEEKDYSSSVFAKVNVTQNKLSDDSYIYLFSKEGRMPLAYDLKGNLRWFLNINTDKQVIYLKNGNILISDTPSSEGASDTLMEVDFLGKVHKTYELEKPYFSNMTELSNNHILYGSNDNTIVEYDLTEGKFVTSYNVNDLFYQIDSNVKLQNGISSIDYDEGSKLILVGIEYNDTLLAFSKTGEVKWIVSGSDYYSDKIQKHYLNQANENLFNTLSSSNAKLNSRKLSGINKDENGKIISFKDFLISGTNISSSWNFDVNGSYTDGDYVINGNEKLILYSNSGEKSDSVVTVLNNNSQVYKMALSESYDYVSKRPFVNEYEFKKVIVKEHKVEKQVSEYKKVNYKEKYKNSENYGIAFTLSGNTLLTHYQAEDYKVVLMQNNHTAYIYKPENGIVNFEKKNIDFLILIEHEDKIYNTGYYISA